MKEPAARLRHFLLARALGLRGRRVLPPRAERLPRSPFPPRRDLVAGEDEDVCIVLRGRLRPLCFPIAWDEPLYADDPLCADGEAGKRELFAMQWIEALDDARFQRAVLDWIENVPRSAFPVRDAAFELRTLPVRCAVWMQQLAARAHRMPAGFADVAAQSIVQQVRFLDGALRWSGVLLREAGRTSTLLDGARTLCWAGSFFAGPEADAWRASGTRRLARALDACFLADGAHASPDASSHARACATLLECRAVLGDHAIQADLEDAIVRSCAALSDRVHPDGCPSLLFGGGLHAGHPPGAILGAAQRLCGLRSVWRQRIALDQAGLCGWRAGKTFFLFACGATGEGRCASQDALAFEWTLHGERIFVAGGSSAPLALTGAGAPGSRARTTRTRLQVLPDGLVAEGLCDAWADLEGRPVHRRLLRSTHDSLRIEDRVEGGAGQDARALLVCHPLARASQSPDGAVTIRRGAVVVRVESKHLLTIEDAVWRPDAGLEVRTQRIAVHFGPAPCAGSIQIQSLSTPHPVMPSLVAGSAR